MKCVRSVAALALSAVLVIAGSPVQANETVDFQGQTIVLLKESTVDAINAEIVQKKLLADKQTAVKALLAADAFAQDGFCETVVKTLAKAPKPTADKLQEFCLLAFNDDELHLAIANGELSKVTDPSQPTLSFRHKLSMAFTGYITMMAISPF